MRVNREEASRVSVLVLESAYKEVSRVTLEKVDENGMCAWNQIQIFHDSQSHGGGICDNRFVIQESGVEEEENQLSLLCVLAIATKEEKSSTAPHSTEQC